MPTVDNSQQPQTPLDQKKAEEVLRQVELIVENSLDAIIGETFEGIITSWNGGATRMFGYTTREMVGKSILSLLPSEMKDELPEQLNKIKQGETIADYDTIRVKKDGSRLNVAISMSPVKNEDGTLIGASVIERDITIRKKSEESMRQIQLVVDNSYDALIGTDLKGIITSWNGGATRMFGYTPIETIGKSIGIINSPEAKDEIQATLDKVISGTPVIDYDSIRMRKDGSMIYVSFSTMAIQTKDGTTIGVSSVIRDDTKRKKSEESMRQIQLVVDNSYDALIGETNEGVITTWNGGAIRMFGYSSQEMVGKSILSLYPSELKDELPKILEEVKLGKVITDYDSVWIRKDTSSANIELSVSPVTSSEGKIIGASIVGRDISGRKKNEDRIKELNDVRSKFVDIIAHQLRTPIGAVNWNLESILNGDFGKLEDTQYKFLLATHEASLKITDRIRDLLTAMDIEEERITFEKREIALDNLIKAVVSEMTEKCKLKNVACEYISPPNELPSLDGDSEKIRSATIKLMENALMYTKEGGKIVAKLALVGDVVRFEVSDTGVGIPLPEQHRVFSRFFRASNASIMQPDAFGLGLFIAKSFIKQHRGKIGFESTEGKGSTFWFEIPLKNGFVEERDDTTATEASPK